MGRPGRQHAEVKLLAAVAVWLGAGLLLGLGVVWTVAGHPWLLIACLLVFIGAAARMGYSHH